VAHGFGDRMILRQGFSMKERPDEIHVRLPADLREAIERAAQAEHRTVSGQVRYLIASAIEARSQQRFGDAVALAR